MIGHALLLSSTLPIFFSATLEEYNKTKNQSSGDRKNQIKTQLIGLLYRQQLINHLISIVIIKEEHISLEFSLISNFRVTLYDSWSVLRDQAGDSEGTNYWNFKKVG